MSENESIFKVGQIVRKKIQKDKIGKIESINYQQGIHWYQIQLNNGQFITAEEDSLEPYTSVQSPEEQFKHFNFSDKNSFSRILSYSKLSGGYSSNPMSLKSSKTLFQPYQYKPLLKFMYSDDQRLLIADEVGLGKTIEAGHILLEMHSRAPIKSLLVICPKSLVLKWQRELSEKFFFEVEIINKSRFMKFLNDYERGNTQKIFSIISYQSIRNRDVIDKIREVNPEIDFVIFDEMHWARNEDSLTHKITQVVSEQANSALGLTATPVMIGSQNLFNILKILNPYEFTTEYDFKQRLEENKPVIQAIRHIGESQFDLALKNLEELSEDLYVNSPIYIETVKKLKGKIETKEEVLKLLRNTTELSLFSHLITRTRRRDVELKAVRRSMTMNISFTRNEKMFYDAITNYIREKYSLINNERRGTNFGLMMPQRQVASCIPAMIKIYASSRMQTQKILSSLKDEYEDDNELNNGKKNNENEEDQINELRQYIRDIKIDQSMTDSKYKELKKALDTIFANGKNTKVLIFSYFKATVFYLSEKLESEGYRNYEITGNKNSEERDVILTDFRNKNNIKILISTEVSSEGLDLEFCNVIVNYDLPWNPMVVEQRIGRLDRIGQKSEVITIINFAVNDTIEARILTRLYDRIEIFKESIGDLESILGDEISKMTEDLLSQNLSPAEEESRITQAADVIIAKKLEAKELEKQSAGLLTYDEFFKQELDAILKEKRYITENELLIYLNEFLKANYIDCQIRSSEEKFVFQMYVSPELEQKIQFSLQQQSSIDEQYFEFTRQIKKFDNRIIFLTFNAELAFNKRELIYINNFHPIVRFVTDYYRTNSKALFPCSSLKMESSDLIAAGQYYYFSWEFEIVGGRKIKNLSHIIINSNVEIVLSESSSAELISELMDNGESQKISDQSNEKAETIMNKARKEAIKRFTELSLEIEQSNESTINKQLEILKRNYDNKIDRINQTISEVQYDTKKAKIIPALKGKIKKLSDEKTTKEFEIMSRKHLDKQMKLISAGVIEIIN